jgi:hypothetical protein
MKFFITKTYDAQNNLVVNVCMQKEGETFYSVVAEVREHNIAEEHGNAEQWALIIGAALNASMAYYGSVDSMCSRKE